jgi:DNA recombination protein RmuC
LRGKVERFAEMSSKVTQVIPEIEPLHNDLQSEKLELLAEPLPSENEQKESKDEAPAT